jgi:YidC/Oxa1 family membrane protein insertase
MIGIWPLIMGVTMFVQMRLNPTPPDPTQAMIFTWMPVVFTFMLASFPAGLVIYWAWNNTLSVAQQYVIMRRQGVEVDLLGNILDTFRKNKKNVAPAAPAAVLPTPANDTRPAKAKGKAGKPVKAKS